MKHRMKRSPIFLGSVLTIALSACGADVNQGVVSSKHYEESYTWFMSQCMPVGKNACGATILIPQTEPEHWVVTLQDCHQKHDTGKKCPSEDHNVDPQTYQRVRVGDNLNLGD